MKNCHLLEWQKKNVITITTLSIMLQSAVATDGIIYIYTLYIYNYIYIYTIAT